MKPKSARKQQPTTHYLLIAATNKGADNPLAKTKQPSHIWQVFYPFPEWHKIAKQQFPVMFSCN